MADTGNPSLKPHKPPLQIQPPYASPQEISDLSGNGRSTIMLDGRPSNAYRGVGGKLLHNLGIIR